jgi:hypothetical protein
MKIKIDEVGYDSFSGRLGVVEFKNGVSVTDVSVMELNRLSSLVRIVDSVTGKQVGVLTEYEQASQAEFKEDAKLADKSEAAFVGVDEKIPQTVVVEKYTKEELEAIADSEGISGLRALAEPLGIKDTSIKGLIASILNKQK